jgi:hypothetical protein
MFISPSPAGYSRRKSALNSKPYPPAAAFRNFHLRQPLNKVVSGSAAIRSGRGAAGRR